MYFHRIGRTARAGKPGIALSLITRQDEDRFKRIRKMTASDLREVTDGIPPENRVGFEVPTSNAPLTNDKPAKDCLRKTATTITIAGRDRSGETVGVKDTSSRSGPTGSDSTPGTALLPASPLRCSAALTLLSYLWTENSVSCELTPRLYLRSPAGLRQGFLFALSIIGIGDSTS